MGLTEAPSQSNPAEVPGLAARQAAVELVSGVLLKNKPLDDLMREPFMPSESRERGLARMIAATVFRRHEGLVAALDALLLKPLSGRSLIVRPILLVGLAQILHLDVKNHAAVDLAVRIAAQDRSTQAYRGLINGVLRNAVRHAPDMRMLIEDPSEYLPQWLRDRWIAAYGEARTRAIADLLLVEPGLDLSVKSDVDVWAEKLGGQALPIGSVRLAGSHAVPDLDGYDSGEWWVQDAAACIPAKLFGDVSGKAIVDLCAAPGGKTAQLASAGAKVTAIDRSAKRFERHQENMERLGLEVMSVKADAANWKPEQLVDGVLLDAPCTATGTLRRHPDLLVLKSPQDIGKLALAQARLLDNSCDMLRPGGRLIYCTCSMEPEEGEDQIARLLEARPEMSRASIEPEEVPGFESAINADGDLRITPEMLTGPSPAESGATGFFIARLTRSLGQ